MRKSLWGVFFVFFLVASLVLSFNLVAFAADGGVKQVSVSLEAPEINPGDTANITITVVTGGDSEAWNGTITVTDPGTAAHTQAVSGTGTESVTVEYPGTFSSTPDTAVVGNYSISVDANVSGQTAVTGEGSFDVKDWYLEISSSPIVSGGTITVTVKTVDTDWDGTITVTEPGGSDTAVYDFTVSQSGDQTTTEFPGGAGWVGTADTATVGAYTVSLDEGTAGGVDDTATFDVQDASPHVGTGFGQTTYACAGCHRTHVGASAAKLLKAESQLALCESCHDGSGANTNVIDGIYLGETQGTQNAGLRGGGFTNALMDTDVDGSMTSTEVTSKHTVASGSSVVVWGSGALGSDDAGESISSFECGSCHNPHGNDMYRILRPQPTGLDVDAPGGDISILASLELAKNYTADYDSNNYRDMGAYPTGVLSQMTEWCGQCHERYEASAGAGSTDRGDDVFQYSHMTEGLGGECLKCHVAHGTSAEMSQNAASGSISWPGDITADWQDTGEDNYSRLLHIDNRGVCMQCHNTTELTSN